MRRDEILMLGRNEFSNFRRASSLSLSLSSSSSSSFLLPPNEEGEIFDSREKEKESAQFRKPFAAIREN